MPFTIVGIDVEKARSLRTQVKELRIFFSGWEAAGKPLPVGHECLWQIMMALDQSMPETAINELAETVDASSSS